MYWLLWHVPDNDNSDMSMQLFRFLPKNVLAKWPPKPDVDPPPLLDVCERANDDVCDVTQSLSIAFEALRLNCSKKLSICTSIELGVPLLMFFFLFFTFRFFFLRAYKTQRKR